MKLDLLRDCSVQVGGMCGLWQEMRVPENGEIPVRVGWGVRRMYSQATRPSTLNNMSLPKSAYLRT